MRQRRRLRSCVTKGPRRFHIYRCVAVPCWLAFALRVNLVLIKRGPCRCPRVHFSLPHGCAAGTAACAQLWCRGTKIWCSCFNRACAQALGIALKLTWQGDNQLLHIETHLCLLVGGAACLRLPCLLPKHDGPCFPLLPSAKQPTRCSARVFACNHCLLL